MSIIDWIVRSSADVWHQEWIVKKKKKEEEKVKQIQVIIQLREQSKNYTVDENIPLIFFFTRWKKKKQRGKAFIQFDQPKSRACLQCHSSSSSEIDIVSKTSITICV